MKRLNELRKLTEIVDKIKEAYGLGFENQYAHYQKEYKKITGAEYPDTELYKALVNKVPAPGLVETYRIAMQLGEEIEHAARNGNDYAYANAQQLYHELTGGYYETQD